MDLKIIPFHRGHDLQGNVKRFHWALVAATSNNAQSIVYQLRGMPGNFRYDGPEDIKLLDEIENRQQELDIGQLPVEELKNLESILADLEVSRAEYGYSCQTWTTEALRAMESRNWLYYPCDAIVSWLKQLEDAERGRSSIV